MKAVFISTGDPRWKKALRLCEHDIYHLPAYVEVAGRQERCQSTAFYAEDSGRLMLIPLLVRRLPDRLRAPHQWRDATSPYGYAGPLISPGCPDSTVAEFVSSFVRLSQQQNIVSAFIRLHPLISFPSDSLTRERVVNVGQTVTIPLQVEQRSIRGDMEHGHKQRIKRLERDGFTAHTDQWSYLPRFIALYRQTMQRVEAGDYYDFSTTYFHDLKSALGDQLHLCTVHSPNGEVASAGLFTDHNGIIQFHLSGSAQQYRRLSPSKLMIYKMMLWGKDRGDRVMHLGGGVGAQNDSLFAFKAGFSKSRATFDTIRIVTDRRRFEHLDITNRSCSSLPAEHSFFPSYRSSRRVRPHRDRTSAVT